MTLEELKQLKLILMNKDEKYVIVKDYKSIIKKREHFFDLQYSLYDIESLEDTAGMVEKCEELFKKSTSMLVNNINDELKKVVIYSATGMIAKSKYIDKIVNSFKKNPLHDNEELLNNKIFVKNILKNYAFLEFSLSPNDTEIGNCTNLYDYFFCGDSKKEKTGSIFINKFTTESVSGIVKYDEFVKKMTDLGYDVKFITDKNNNLGLLSKEFGNIKIIADLRDYKTKVRQ